MSTNVSIVNDVTGVSTTNEQVNVQVIECLNLGTTSPLTTKGDIYTFDTDDTRLPVGTDGYALVADSSETTGLKWDLISTNPAGNDGEIQFNSSGSFGSDSNFFWDSINTSLGIGTSNPTSVQMITIDGNSTNSSSIKFFTDASGKGIADGFQIGTVAANNVNVEFYNYENGYFRFGTNNDYVASFHASGGFSFGDGYISNDPGENNMIIEGNVGIGVTTPLSKLHINGGVGSLSTGLTFGDGDTGFYEISDDVYQTVVGNISQYETASGTLRALINGQFEILTKTSASSTQPIYVFRGDSSTGIGRAGTDQLSLIAGGIEGIRVQTDRISLKSSVKTTTGDPTTPASGDITINEFDNAIKIYADGAWRTISSW